MADFRRCNAVTDVTVLSIEWYLIYIYIVFYPYRNTPVSPFHPFHRFTRFTVSPVSAFHPFHLFACFTVSPVTALRLPIPFHPPRIISSRTPERAVSGRATCPRINSTVPPLGNRPARASSARTRPVAWRVAAGRRSTLTMPCRGERAARRTTRAISNPTATRTTARKRRNATAGSATPRAINGWRWSGATRTATQPTPDTTG
jgi:hypothetical protein